MKTNFHQRRKGELAKEILIAISVGIIIPAAFVLPNLPLILKPLLRVLSKKHKTRTNSLCKSISRLKKNRLVEIKEKDNQQILVLTEKGKRRILQYDLENITIKKPKKWDSLWHVVIFDIPENQKQGREALRNRLKAMGFYQLQKSCFIHPYECKNEIAFVSEIFQIAPHVNLLIVKHFEGVEELKQYFALN